MKEIGPVLLIIALWCSAPVFAVVTGYSKLDVLAALIVPFPLDWLWLALSAMIS